MIRLDAIPSARSSKREFRIFTSTLSGLALLGIYINCFGILVH